MINLQFQYKPFFKLELKNNYFQDEILRGYQIKETLPTKQLIEHLGMVLKITPEGVFVLVDNGDPERLIKRMEQLKGTNSKLKFLFFIKDPIFKNYTEVPFDTNSKLFYFSNRDLGDKTEGKLHKSNYVSVEDLFKLKANGTLEGKDDVRVPTEEKGFPVGLIELELSDSIIDKFIDKMMDEEVSSFNYNIDFNSRSVVWKYFIIPGYQKKLKGLKIVPQNNQEGIKFSAGEEVTLKGDRKALVFESEAPLKFKEIYNYNFQLKRGEGENGGKTIVKKMQFASIDLLKPHNSKEADNYCSEIYIYI